MSLRSLCRSFVLGVLLVVIGNHAQAAEAPLVLLVFGDSISAGYGLPPGTGWVALLAERMKAKGYRYTVVNGSISGDTTAGGRARLPASLKQHQPTVVVLELGGNDALRGGTLSATRANLEAMVDAATSAGAHVLIVGMQLPSNYGPAYVRDFNALFGDVAKAKRVGIVPAFFAGFGDDLNLFQSDGIHPTAGAQARLLNNVWPALQPLLKR
jgi:acyl-CoA thioesterase I